MALVPVRQHVHFPSSHSYETGTKYETGAIWIRCSNQLDKEHNLYNQPDILCYRLTYSGCFFKIVLRENSFVAMMCRSMM